MKKMRQFLYSVRVLLSARDVQDYLWGNDRHQAWGTWVDVLEKRIGKLRSVDRTSRHWQIESRKRLLQIAAVSIAMIEWIDDGASGA